MIEKKTEKSEVHVIDRARGFWGKFSKPIIYVGGAIILLAAAWLGYKYFVKLPKEQQANDVVFITQKYFAEFSNAPSDSSKKIIAEKVLNGDGTNPGALKIISRFGGTDAANLCEYYAGACYLNLKQFDKAIKYLKEFDGNGADQIQSRADGMIGDAYAEQKKNEDALDYYKKAADVNKKDEFTTSEFLFRAAMFAESIGKTKDAVSLYKEIRDDYPTSDKAANVDKYLARLGEVSE